MKSFCSGLILLFATAGLCHAATITVTNSSGPSFTSILNIGGASALTSGVVVLGTFTVEPVSVANILGGNFTQAGNSVGFFGAGAPGFFTGAINTGTLTAGDAFVGKTVYAVFGNGTTLANSTGLAVWKATSNAAGNTFTADNPVGGPDTVTVLDTRGQLIVGVVNPAFFTTGFGTAPAFQLVAVPEPSSLLLGALGLLALLRRKR